TSPSIRWRPRCVRRAMPWFHHGAVWKHRPRVGFQRGNPARQRPPLRNRRRPMQPALTAAAPVASTRGGSGAVPAGPIRRSEWVVLAFLFYAQLLTGVLPVPAAIPARIAAWNAAIALAYAILIYVDFAKPTLVSGITRDWLPLAVVVLAYREM